MDFYTKLAREAIKTYLETGKKIEVLENLPQEMLEEKAGVFVSLYNKEDHSLRGCIGTFLPTKKNIAQEIISNAISAATRDPRFFPLNKEEIDNIKISVDVLSKPEIIKNVKELDPKKYGILIKTEDGRSALLLPDLEGVDTVKKQISITCRKGGIDPSIEKIIIYKFTVERHK